MTMPEIKVGTETREDVPMPAKVRRIMWSGEEWVNVNDLKDHLNDDEAIKHAAAMMLTAKDKGDETLHAVRLGIAFFVTNSMGVT